MRQLYLPVRVRVRVRVQLRAVQCNFPADHKLGQTKVAAPASSTSQLLLLASSGAVAATSDESANLRSLSIERVSQSVCTNLVDAARFAISSSAFHTHTQVGRQNEHQNQSTKAQMVHSGSVRLNSSSRGSPNPLKKESKMNNSQSAAAILVATSTGELISSSQSRRRSSRRDRTQDAAGLRSKKLTPRIIPLHPSHPLVLSLHHPKFGLPQVEP